MERELPTEEARQGNTRRFPRRVLVISTAIAAVLLFLLLFLFVGMNP